MAAGFFEFPEILREFSVSIADCAIIKSDARRSVRPKSPRSTPDSGSCVCPSKFIAWIKVLCERGLGRHKGRVGSRWSRALPGGGLSIVPSLSTLRRIRGFTHLFPPCYVDQCAFRVGLGEAPFSERRPPQRSSSPNVPPPPTFPTHRNVEMSSIPTIN